MAAFPVLWREIYLTCKKWKDTREDRWYGPRVGMQKLNWILNQSNLSQRDPSRYVHLLQLNGCQPLPLGDIPLRFKNLKNLHVNVGGYHLDLMCALSNLERLQCVSLTFRDTMVQASPANVTIPACRAGALLLSCGESGIGVDLLEGFPHLTTLILYRLHPRALRAGVGITTLYIDCLPYKLSPTSEPFLLDGILTETPHLTTLTICTWEASGNSIQDTPLNSRLYVKPPHVPHLRNIQGPLPLMMGVLGTNPQREIFRAHLVLSSGLYWGMGREAVEVDPVVITPEDIHDLRCLLEVVKNVQWLRVDHWFHRGWTQEVLACLLDVFQGEQLVICMGWTEQVAPIIRLSLLRPDLILNGSGEKSQKRWHRQAC